MINQGTRASKFAVDFKDTDFRLIKNCPEEGRVVSEPVKLHWEGEAWPCDIVFDGFGKTTRGMEIYDYRLAGILDSEAVSMCDMTLHGNKKVANETVKWIWFEDGTCYIEV